MGKSVNIVVEDVLSEAVITTLLKANGGHKVAASYPIKKGFVAGTKQTGYGYIKKSLPAFNKAADKIPFVVLFDQDDRPCPPQTITEWLGGSPKHPNLIVRIASREVEAWLLADKKGLADFLSISPTNIPENPETIADPKELIVKLAASSRSSEIRNDMAPKRGNSATTGPYFSRALSMFARSNWDFETAASRSESLRRAILNIGRL